MAADTNLSMPIVCMPLRAASSNLDERSLLSLVILKAGQYVDSVHA